VRAANGLPVPELGIQGMYPDTRTGTPAGRPIGPIAGEPTAAMQEMAPDGILVSDGQGGVKKVQATKDQASRAARGLPVPELGIAGMAAPGAGTPAPGAAPAVPSTAPSGAPPAGSVAPQRYFTPEETKQNEAALEDYKNNVQQPFQAGQKARFALDQIENAMQNHRTGYGQDTALDLQKKVMSGMSLLGMTVPDDFKQSIASGEIIRKSGNALGFEMANSLVGKGESTGVVNQAIQSNPGLAVSDNGNIQLIGLMKQGIQRDADKNSFYNQWFRDHGTYADAGDAFNKAYPVETYVSQILPYKANTKAEADKLPPGTRFIGPDNNIHIRGQ
jgi:hypothetical protein